MRHAHTVTVSSAAVALLQARRFFSHILLQQVRIGLKAAIGDNHSASTPLVCDAIVFTGHAHTAAVFHNQRLGFGPARERATALEEIGFQRAQQHIAATAFPIQPRTAAPRRRPGGASTHL